MINTQIKCLIVFCFHKRRDIQILVLSLKEPTEQHTCLIMNKADSSIECLRKHLINNWSSQLGNQLPQAEIMWSRGTTSTIKHVLMEVQKGNAFALYISVYHYMSCFRDFGWTFCFRRGLQLYIVILH